MARSRTATIVCMTLFPFSGAAENAQREPCEIFVNSRNVATCVLPKANARLECDRSIGQPLPQCITEDGRFADCVYGQIVAGGPPGIGRQENRYHRWKVWPAEGSGQRQSEISRGRLDRAIGCRLATAARGVVRAGKASARYRHGIAALSR